MKRSFRQSLNLGFPAVAQYWWHSLLPGDGVTEMKPRAALHPLRLRPGDSDIDVLTQVFIEQHYSGVRVRNREGLILDCGANVGVSAAYFLSRFPAATVMAVEPDPDNFDLLERNLAAYGARAKPVHAAIWGCDRSLQMRLLPYDDGRSWARQVEETHAAGVAKLKGRSIQSLLDESGFDRLALLKMDIEGAEVDVFRGSCQDWLSRTDCIAIELHEDTHFGDAKTAFFEAVKPFAPRIMRTGEIVVADFIGGTADGC